MFQNTCGELSLYGKLEGISFPTVLTVHSEAQGLITRVAELMCQLKIQLFRSPMLM